MDSFPDGDVKRASKDADTPFTSSERIGQTQGQQQVPASGYGSTAVGLDGAQPCIATSIPMTATSSALGAGFQRSLHLRRRRTASYSGRQFLAMARLHLLLRARSFVSTSLEQLLPILLTLFTVLLYSLSSTVHNEGGHYVDPTRAAAARTSMWMLSRSLCYDATQGSAVEGLEPCSTSEGSLSHANTGGPTSLRCFGKEDGVPADNVCLNSSLLEELRSASEVVMWSAQHAVMDVPTLDDLIKVHWAIRCIEAMAGVALTGPVARSIRSCGYLFFSSSEPCDADRKRGTKPSASSECDASGLSVAGFITHLNESSRLFRYVYGGSFASVSDFDEYVVCRRATGPASGHEAELNCRCRGPRAVNNNRHVETWGGVHVNSITAGALDIAVRLNASAIPASTQPAHEYNYGGLHEYGAQYFLSGFLTLQREAYDYFALSTGATLPEESLALAPMSTVDYTLSAFLHTGFQVAPIILALGCLFPFMQSAKRVVLDKELRIREVMLIMGLQSTSLFGSWFIVESGFQIVAGVSVAVILSLSYLSKASLLVLVTLCVLFFLASTSLAGLIASLFSKTRLVTVTTPLLFMAMTLPLFVLSEIPSWAQRLLCLMPPTAFGLGITLLLTYEASHGLALRDVASPQEDPCMALVLLILVGDTVLYLLLMVYLDAVLPTAWGAPTHPLLCLAKSLAQLATQVRRQLRRCWSRTPARGAPWEVELLMLKGEKTGSEALCHSPSTEGLSSGKCLPRDLSTSSRFFEVPTNEQLQKTTVQIRGLRKSFQQAPGRNFVAVDNLYWNLREGEISVLLGYNGAGKSTIIDLITGMVRADAGDCIVYGSSIRTNLAAARQEMSLCPQHNILWPTLTCAEHLHLFASIKGLPSKYTQSAVDDVVEALELQSVRDTPSFQLSGGQRRKLSVAVALVGDSHLVVLDEPTAGMDVCARRRTWDLLNKASTTRTVLMTTHFMDEADILGRQIAVLSRGRLQCSGSSLFLKKNLGVGYVLTLSVEQSAHTRPRAISTLIHRYIPSNEMLPSGACELVYRLPMEWVSSFPGLLRKIERDGKALGIRSFTLSATTLEDIFLKIAMGDEGRAVPPEVYLSFASARRTRSRGGSLSSFAESAAGTIISYPQRCGGWRRILQGLQLVWRPFAGRNAETPSSDWYETVAQGLPLLEHVEQCTTPPGADGEPALGSSCLSGDRVVISPEDPCGRRLDDGTFFRELTDDVDTSMEGFSEVSRGGGQSESDSRRLRGGEDMDLCGGPASDENFSAYSSAPQLWDSDRVTTYSGLLCSQLSAVVLKRLRSTMRDRRTQFLQLVFPAVVFIVAMLLNTLQFRTRPAVLLTTEMYGEVVEVVVCSCNATLNLSALESPWQKVRVVETYIAPDAGSSSSGSDSWGWRDVDDAVSLSAYLQHTFYGHRLPRFGAIVCNDPDYGNVVFHNTSSYHESAIGLSNYYNALLALRGKESESASTSAPTVRVSSSPLPLTERQAAFVNLLKSLVIGVLLVTPFTLIPSTCVGWIVRERESKARHLQRVSGLYASVYWAANFLFDLGSFAVTTVLAIVILAAFQHREYTALATIGATTALLVAYGVSSIAMAYAVSFCFHDAGSAQNTVLVGNFIAGLLLVMLVMVLEVIPVTFSIGATLRWPFRLVPSYCIGEGIINLSLLQGQRDLGFTTSTPWSLNVVGLPLVFMLLQLPLFSAITFLADQPHWRARLARSLWCICQWTRRAAVDHDGPVAAVASGWSHEDPDVASERAVVEDPEQHGRLGDLVRVLHLNHRYPNGCVAVRNVSFGVRPGEIFGFLGANEAGKTTVLSILSQDIVASSGEITICGCDITNDADAALRCIGYCPQFDALLDLLTVVEHLQLYAGIRGLSARRTGEGVIHVLLRLFDLEEYAHTLAGALSGGSRRKLSVAIALIGAPRVVFLDEPSTGMDPVARRGMWSVIEAISHRCAVVLTSHHLEEVEALAHRVAIMVDGSLRCIGDKTHLKNQFGSGFEMHIRVADTQALLRVDAFVQQHLPAATLSESRGPNVTYALPQNTLLSAAFALLNEHQSRLHISTYSISQTSLEQVFIRIIQGSEAAPAAATTTALAVAR